MLLVNNRREWTKKIVVIGMLVLSTRPVGRNRGFKNIHLRVRYKLVALFSKHVDRPDDDTLYEVAPERMPSLLCFTDVDQKCQQTDDSNEQTATSRISTE